MKTNPEVAKIFNDFAASMGVSMKAGATMNEVIADLMTIFHFVQGDASARNQEFKLRQLQYNVGIMASRLHGAGFSQMGDKFLDLFGSVDTTFILDVAGLYAQFVWDGTYWRILA